MIKVKLNYRELEAFSFYLNHCIMNVVKSQDKVKEYLLAAALNSLMQRIIKKQDANFYHGTENKKKYTININNNEAVALSIYFNRCNVSMFLIPTQEQILNQFNKTELINILK